MKHKKRGRPFKPIPTKVEYEQWLQRYLTNPPTYEQWLSERLTRRINQRKESKED